MDETDDPSAEVIQLSLTKREIIAAMMLQGFLSSGRKETVHEGMRETIESAAIRHADNLINQLKEK